MDEQENKAKKFDLFLIAIIIIGIIVLIAQIYLVSQSNVLGSRAAEYGALADNLLKGRGFTLDYVDQYYIKFDSVSHPLEWDYQMMGILIAPFIALLGKTQLAVRLPTMIIGTILFPILVYYLGKELFDKKIGFLAAVSVLFYARIFDLISNGQRDMAFSFFALAGIYFFYRGMKEDSTKYFYLMGLFLGISYLVRQTTLIIIPILILAYYLIKKEVNFKLIKGMLLSILIISPWLVRNYLIFGDPLFTANKYAQWISGWFEFEQLGYKIFWHEQKPSFSWLFSAQQLVARPQPLWFVALTKTLRSFAVQFEVLVFPIIAAFVGIVITTKEKIEKSFLLAIGFVILFTMFTFSILVQYFITTFAFVVFVSIPYFVILAVISLKLAKESPRNTLLILLWIVFALFHALFVFAAARFMLPLIPFFFIFAWAGANKILELISKDYPTFKTEHIGKYLAAFLLIFILVNLPTISAISTYQKEDTWMFEAINKATEKDAVIMACNVQPLNFFTGRKFVEVPNDRIESVIEVLQTYNASYITFSGCGQRLIDPNFYYAITARGEVPTLHSKVLYKLKLDETREGFNRTVSINTVTVAGVRNESLFWETEHLN